MTSPLEDDPQDELPHRFVFYDQNFRHRTTMYERNELRSTTPSGGYWRGENASRNGEPNPLPLLDLGGERLYGNFSVAYHRGVCAQRDLDSLVDGAPHDVGDVSRPE